MSPRNNGGSSGRGEADTLPQSERRRELLAIAEDLFATKGYAETTVRDIAQHGGILSGSLYHHFSSKDEMAHEILRSFVDDLHTKTAAAVAAGGSATDLVDRLVRDAFEIIHERPLTVALYQNEASSLATQPGFGYLVDAGREVEQVWRSAIISGQEGGEFRPDLDARILYRFIRDTVWSSVRWYRPGGSYTPTVLADQFLALLHGGLLQR